MVGMACEWLELTDGLGHPKRGIVKDLEVYESVEIDSNEKLILSNLIVVGTKKR